MAIAQMRREPNPTRSSSLRRVLSGGTWLVNHTKPPYIQKSTVRISAVRIAASTETPCSSSDVSWVSVKTKTRSKNSSRFETPRSMGSGATLRDARTWGYDSGEEEPRHLWTRADPLIARAETARGQQRNVLARHDRA